MNSAKTLFSRWLAAVFLAGSLASAASAQYLGGDLQLDLDTDEDVQFLAGDVRLNGVVRADVEGLAADVVIDAEITGDVSIAGADIALAGLVGGDVSLAGADLSIDAAISGDVDAAGADIRIGGPIGGDLAAAGAIVLLEREASVMGDAELAGREVALLGSIGGGAEVRGREVRIEGEVSRDLEIRAREVEFAPGAVIGGDLTVTAQTEPVLPEDLVVTGTYTFEQRNFSEGDFNDFNPVDLNFGFGPPQWAFGAAFAISAFVLGMLASLIAPKSVAGIAGHFRRRPWISGLLGLVVLAFLPILVLTLFIFLLVTVIGIPLAFILVLAMPVVMFLAFAFGGIGVGDLIFNRSGEPMSIGLRALSLFLVLAVIGAVGVVPGLGWLATAVLLCIGLGAWTLAIFSRNGDSGGHRPVPAADAAEAV